MRNVSAPRKRLVTCALALLLSVLLACGGEGATDPGGPGQGTRPAATTSERAAEETPAPTGAASAGAATSAPQSGSTPAAGARAGEGTPAATGAASTGAAASTRQPGSTATPGAAGRSASLTQPTATEAPEDGSKLEEYAAQHAGRPGAIYVGDITQLVGPAPEGERGSYLKGGDLRDLLSYERPSRPTPTTPSPAPTRRVFGEPTHTPAPTPSPTPAPEEPFDVHGNVTLKALERHLWIYESPFYSELIERAKLTDPTPLSSSGEEIIIEHICFSPASCQLLLDYFAPNVRGRTNGQVEFHVVSGLERGISGWRAPFAVADGEVQSSTIDGEHLGHQHPPIEIQRLWGIHSSREQEFEVSQAIIKDVEEMVLAGTGGVIMNHSWYAGNDHFLFCNDSITGMADLKGRKVIAWPGTAVDWVDGMGAEGHPGESAFVGVELYEGRTDCATASLSTGYEHEWYRVTSHLTGPLPNFSFHNNVINREVWDGIPADLQQIILEEAAKSELENLRIAAGLNEVMLQSNISGVRDSGLEFTPFSEEMKRGSFDAAVNSVIPGWVERVGDASHPIIADTFNKKLGPIIGLRIDLDGTVVRTE